MDRCVTAPVLKPEKSPQPPAGFAGTARLERASIDRPVRLALVGANFGAGIARHLVGEANPWVTLTGICDLNPHARQALAQELELGSWNELDDALNDPEVEGIALFTPPQGRAGLIRRAIRAGKHVLTTKPFELSEPDARRALEEAADAGLVIHLNSPSPRGGADIRQIREWCNTFSLGAPIGFHAETWADYHESPSGDWKDDPSLCVAAPILRIGVYFLNDFLPLLGEPVSLHAEASRIRTARPTADNAQISVAFANGALGTVFASFCVSDGHPYTDHISLKWERGHIERWMKREAFPNMSRDRAHLRLRLPDGRTEEFTTPRGDYAGWYDWEAFHAAVRHGAASGCLQSPDTVLYGVRLLEAMRQSIDSGKPWRKG
jgi:predicted dehydrogenase